VSTSAWTGGAPEAVPGVALLGAGALVAGAPTGAAEVAALEAFRADESLDVVRASTTEVYATESVPAEAVVYFRGVDEHAGAMTKYVRIEPYANP
jgi:hypothetical protein